MYNLLIFLLFSAVFVLGYAGMIKWLFAMMQPDGAFDVVSKGKWTKMKDNLYGKRLPGTNNPSPKHQMLDNVLGGCEQCTSFWWALPWSVLYFTFCYTSGIWCLGVVASIIWALLFISVCSYIGLKTLTRNGV